MEEGLVIILQSPQMAENIGMAARAMVNCGVRELRLINPQCGWPNRKADLASAEKLSCINTMCYATLIEAVSDLNCVIATSARVHDVIKETVSLATCADIICKKLDTGNRTGVLFGPENNGLSNKDIALCNLITCIESNDFSSYNLAQAVLLVCYNYMIRKNQEVCSSNWHIGKTRFAAKIDIARFVDFFITSLDNRNYFKCEEKKDVMALTIRNFFMRSDMTNQEVNSLFGAIRGLCELGEKHD